MDKYEYAHNDGDYSNFDDTEELVGFLRDYDLATEEEIKEIEDWNLEDAFEFVLDNLNEDRHFEKIPVVRVAKIIPNTLFLTKKAAKEHMKANHYHYNDTVHTYAMTAWRSPEVENLFRIIENLDLEELERVIWNANDIFYNFNLCGNV